MPSLDPYSKHIIPPPFKRKIWVYKTAKIDQIRADLLKANWNDLFLNLNVSEKSLVSTDVFLDFMAKNISSKMITCNEEDAAWITPEVKTATKRNSRVHRRWVNRGRNPCDHDKVREIRNATNKLIKEVKLAYYTNLCSKLSDPNTGQKHFWTAYKKIINKKVNTNTPPIIDNGVYISNCKQKADIFNQYFANQCTVNDNSNILLNFISKTDASLSHVSVTRSQIINIIINVNSDKAHGCDGISVAMLKLCAVVVAIPLQIIFNDCINSGLFPDSLKYVNVQPIHKKDNRQTKSNYRPISLLPTCGKILEKIVFDQVYAFLNVYNLLSKKQSGFTPGDSTIYQLLSITSTIYESFEKYEETCAVFLDISKAFDKVWHEGIIFKLKCNGVSGILVNIFENYLSNRYQPVVLNGRNQTG